MTDGSRRCDRPRPGAGQPGDVGWNEAAGRGEPGESGGRGDARGGSGAGPGRQGAAAGHRSARSRPRPWYPDECDRSDADRHRELRRLDDRLAPPVPPTDPASTRTTRGGPPQGEEWRSAAREVDTRPRLGARGPAVDRRPSARRAAGAGGPAVAQAAGAGRSGVVRWLQREMVFASVLVGVAVGFVLVYQDRWRRGMLVIGVVLALAGLARLALPTRLVGLLAVRGRVFDTVILLLLGASVITLTSAVPYPGP
ncbi:DUF3017 domain-containing protein [Candidatus Frankia alpina]|nr:DUF3017 domain-containing protein [Candidatus Frankia alpina]